MDLLKRYFILVLVSFYNHATLTFAATRITSKIFSHKQQYQGKTCPSADRMFTIIVRRKTACVELCTRTIGCTAVTIVQNTFVCTGCNGFYPSTTDLIDQSDALFYIVNCGRPTVDHNSIELATFDGNSEFGAQITYICKNPIFYSFTSTITCLSDAKWSTTHCEYVDCGTPLTVNNAIYQNFDGYTRYGAEVKFRCSPCTYFSLSSTWKIRCQADGSWTIPDCVYGPDVGLLRNGAVIPAQAVGCNSSLGTTCREHALVEAPALKYNGWDKSSCYCDTACCSADDCCYDYVC